MKLGVRAHDFGQLPADQLAACIAQQGLSCVQLAPPKAIADYAGNGDQPLTPAFARRVRDVFQGHGVEISVLGCYVNLGDPDETRRRPQLERFKNYLRLAHDFGCGIVGTETGSLNGDFSRHADNQGETAFQIVLESVRELVREAARCNVMVCIEPVERYVISSPQRLRRLLDEVSSPHLQVIYDPVNLLWSSNHERQDEIMNEAHALLGDRIRIVHAKDFTVQDGAFSEQPAGGGQLHYSNLMRWLKTNAPDVPVLLENTDPSSIAETISFMRAAYGAA